LLLANDASTLELRHNARRLVQQRYDWQQIGRRFVDLVEDAVRQRGGS
jgi:glycosyltransferase involved in cell wall biosynthesis